MRNVILPKEVVYKIRVFGNFAGLGIVGHFDARNQTRKIDKIHKDFGL